jgi:hypothetical protein
MDEVLPADFFLLRTPTLPWNIIEELGADLEAPRALRANGDVACSLERDATLLRARLRELVRRPEVRCAIRVASPNLDARLGAWLDGDDSESARSVEPAVARYVMRMAGRATPFGLFAGTTFGRVGEVTELVVPPLVTYERHTRVDLDWLVALADRVSKDPAVRSRLQYRANDTVYEAGGRLRYYELRVGKGKRSYSLCEIPASSALQSALTAARRAITIEELARAIVASEGADLADATAFVERLVELQLLRPSLHPALTGPSPAVGLVDHLCAVPEAVPVAEALQVLLAELAAIDRATWSGSGESLRPPIAALEALGLGSPTLKVDLRKPCESLLLGRPIASAIAAGVRLLASMVHEPEQAIDRFARDFEARYQGREVSLLEALDPECGVGFDPAPPGTDVSPLLEGLDFDGRSGGALPWTRREELVMTRLAEALGTGATEIELSERELDTLACTDDRRLPAGLNAIVTIAAPSRDALEHGDYRLFVQAGGTTTGALLGRFLGDDPELDKGVRGLLRREEEVAPEAIHAEIVHLPSALTSNSVCRPVLRQYEIEVGGGSGAPSARRIPVADLLVSVRGRRIQLRSRSLGRRVVVHLSCAHAYETGHPAYRFLAMLQEHGVRSHVSWSWGQAFATAPFLPRVIHGKFVFSLARWRVSTERLRPIGALGGGGALRCGPAPPRGVAPASARAARRGRQRAPSRSRQCPVYREHARRCEA